MRTHFKSPASTLLGVSALAMLSVFPCARALAEPKPAELKVYLLEPQSERGNVKLSFANESKIDYICTNLTVSWTTLNLKSEKSFSESRLLAATRVIPRRSVSDHILFSDQFLTECTDRMFHEGTCLLEAPAFSADCVEGGQPPQPARENLPALPQKTDLVAARSSVTKLSAFYDDIVTRFGTPRENDDLVLFAVRGLGTTLVRLGEKLDTALAGDGVSRVEHADLCRDVRSVLASNGVAKTLAGDAPVGEITAEVFEPADAELHSLKSEALKCR